MLLKKFFVSVMVVFINLKNMLIFTACVISIKAVLRLKRKKVPLFSLGRLTVVFACSIVIIILKICTTLKMIALNCKNILWIFSEISQKFLKLVQMFLTCGKFVNREPVIHYLLSHGYYYCVYDLIKDARLGVAF